MVSELTRHRTTASAAMLRIVDQQQPQSYPAFASNLPRYSRCTRASSNTQPTPTEPARASCGIRLSQGAQLNLQHSQRGRLPRYSALHAAPWSAGCREHLRRPEGNRGECLRIRQVVRLTGGANEDLPPRARRGIPQASAPGARISGPLSAARLTRVFLLRKSLTTFKSTLKTVGVSGGFDHYLAKRT